MEDNNNQDLEQQVSSLEESTMEKNDSSAMGKKALKDAANLATKELKSKVKAIVTKYAASVAIIIAKILLILFVVLVIIGAIEWIKEKFEAKESPKMFKEALGITEENEEDMLKEFVQIKKDDSGDGYHFEFADDFEEKVEKAAEYVGKKYSNLGDKELWKEFLMADFATQLPNLGGSGQVISTSEALVTGNVSVSSLDGFLFIGDSITVGLENSKKLKGKDTQFVGSTGSTPKQWLKNTTPASGEPTYSELPDDSDKIKGISIMLGTNEVSQVSEMIKLVQKIHEKYPNRPIFVQKIFQQNNYFDEITNYNNQMLQFCNSNDYATFIDATNGVEISDDGIHPTSKGYKTLAKNIKKAIINVNSSTTDLNISGTSSTVLKPEDSPETTDELTDDEESFINKAPKEFQGTIKMKRIAPNRTPGTMDTNVGLKTTELKYVSPEEFDDYISKGDSKALDTFTLSDDFSEIITAKWSYDGSIKIEKNSGIDYGNLTANYAMPYEYPMMFQVTGKDALFSQRLMYLVLGSSVDVCLVDNVSITQTKEYTTTTTTTTDPKKKTSTTTTNTSLTGDEYKENVYTSTELGAVNSWWAKRSSTYTLNANSNFSSTTGDAYTVTGENKTTTTQIKKEITNISYSIRSQNTDFESNHEPFCTIYNGSRGKANTQVNWLLDFMGENDRTANMVELTKYLLYKATGVDYGVTEFDDIDFSRGGFDISDGGSSGISGNAGIVYDFFLGKGIPAKSVAAMMGNFEKESGFDFMVVQGHTGDTAFNTNYTNSVDSGTISKDSFIYNGPGGGGYGLAQWTDQGRKQKLYEFAKNRKASIGDANTQLEFVMEELNNGYSSTLDYLMNNSDQSIATLTLQFHNGYEGSADTAEMLTERIANAENLYNQYLNSHTSSGNSNTACTFDINLYNSNGSVNEAKIVELEKEETKIINNYRSYPFFNNNGLSYLQCTWWANARASTYLSKYGTKYKEYPTNMGNGGDYWQNNINGGWFKYGQTPRANSLLGYAASGNMGGWGHITYVEAVDPVNKKIYISHCSSGERWNGIGYNWGSEHHYTLDWDGRLWGDLPQGYIYLDEPN